MQGQQKLAFLSPGQSIKITPRKWKQRRHFGVPDPSSANGDREANLLARERKHA